MLGVVKEEDALHQPPGTIETLGHLEASESRLLWAPLSKDGRAEEVERSERANRE